MCHCAERHVHFMRKADFAAKREKYKTVKWSRLTELVHTSPENHGGSGVQPSDHSRTQHGRRHPGCQDGPQSAPTRLQADDLEHAECRVTFQFVKNMSAGLQMMIIMIFCVVVPNVSSCSVASTTD